MIKVKVFREENDRKLSFICQPEFAVYKQSDGSTHSTTERHKHALKLLSPTFDAFIKWLKEQKEIPECKVVATVMIIPRYIKPENVDLNHKHILKKLQDSYFSKLRSEKKNK